ncbi:MAG: gamma-glutamylcyclotransferase family protein, partial [Nocardioides sp.]
MTRELAERVDPPRLFAYGSLAPGRPNAHILDDLAGTWEPATTTGHLVHDDWGAALGYPALVLD